jgi:lysophospholipase L1-like esterase
MNNRTPSELPGLKKRRWIVWKRLGYLIGGILVLATILEVGLRIASGRNQSKGDGWDGAQQYWAIYDPDLGYRPNPAFGEFNSDGLRDHPVGPKGDRFRILFLGDSLLTGGDTVDETIAGHLRTTLHRDPGLEQIDVVNAGIRGYTNYQEILYLKKYGLKFHPDVVGVQFCLNDLFKVLQTFQVEDGRVVPGTYHYSTEAINQSPSLLRRWAMKSYLLVWVRNHIPIAGKAADLQAMRGFSFDYKLDVRTAWQDKPWEEIERQLAELVDLGHQHHFGTFLTVVPMAVQYRPEYLARDRGYVLKPQRKLREICERLHISFYDPYAEMSPEMFLPDGLHLNKSGNQMLGERVAAHLEQSGLLSEALRSAHPPKGQK